MRPLLRVTASHIRLLLTTQWRSLLCLTTINLCLIQVETLALMASTLCVLRAHLVSKLTYRLKDNSNHRHGLYKLESFFSFLFYLVSSHCYHEWRFICHGWLTLAKLFSKCQAVISLTSKRRWQLSRSVSLWWISTMAGHWLGRSCTCLPVTNHWPRGGKEVECSFIEAW